MDYRCLTCGGIEKHDPACPAMIAQYEAECWGETGQWIAAAVVLVVGLVVVVWLALL